MVPRRYPTSFGRGGDDGNIIPLTRRWKRGLRYGTLICNLENNRPIDVLPDRWVETVSAWFEKRPSVEIVSRDRSSEYTAAISKGAPQALQVADVWHIGKNLVDSVQTLLARCRAEIRRKTGQSKRRGRLPFDTGFHADDPRAYRRAVGHLAQLGRKEYVARVQVVCQRYPTR